MDFRKVTPDTINYLFIYIHIHIYLHTTIHIHIHTYRSRLIARFVAEASQIFLQDAHQND
jgi:hypothetical protein